MSPDYNLRNDTDLITQHPPERGERKKSYLVVYSCGSCCSCCCCCCLHTLGGVIGAAVAGNYHPEADAADKSPSGNMKPNSHQQLPSSQGLYWTSLLIVIALGVVVTPIFQPWSDLGTPVVTTGVLVLIFGPAWMLGASLLAAFRISKRGDLPSKDLYIAQLGKITGGMLLGSLAGLLIMGVIAMLLTGGR